MGQKNVHMPPTDGVWEILTGRGVEESRNPGGRWVKKILPSDKGARGFFVEKPKEDITMH